MSKYKEIKGFKVQTLASDTVASAIAGATWSAGGDLNTARASQGGAGTASTAALVFGGQTPGNTAVTESYNGSTWTEVNDLNDSRKLLGGTGSQTAALAAGGNSPHDASVESWNGSSWTEVTGLGTARRGNNGLFGVQTAAVFCGGYLPSGPGTGKTEVWNGSSWTETGDLNTSRWAFSSGGTTTAGIAFAGEAPNIAATEEFNGSAWTEVNDLNTGRGEVGGSGGPGSQTSILCFGGGSPPGAKNEHFDGTSWTELNDLSIARNQVTKTNISSPSALCIGGGQPGSPYNAQTEHFDTPATFTKINLGQVYFNSGSNAFKVTEQPVPGGTWASSNTLNSPRSNAGSSGTQTAALFFGGDGPPGTLAITEEYNGSSWSEVADLNVARSQMFFSNQGTQTAALSATGYPVSTNVESWNGSSWTETTENNTGRRNGASFGTQTAMLGTGGYIPPGYQTLAEQWDGSSWTEVANCPDPKFISRGGGGTTTAGIIAGNYPNGDVDGSQLWDGSSWTAGPNLNQGRSGIAFSATSQSNALAHGGGVGAPQAASALTEFYNGTSWTELNDMAQGSQSGGGAGSSVLGIHMGGGGPGALTTTEEWTVPEANTTITVS